MQKNTIHSREPDVWFANLPDTIRQSASDNRFLYDEKKSAYPEYHFFSIVLEAKMKIIIESKTDDMVRFLIVISNNCNTLKMSYEHLLNMGIGYDLNILINELYQKLIGMDC